MIDYDFTFTTDYLTKAAANKVARQMIERGMVVWMRRVASVRTSQHEYLVYSRPANY